MAVLALEGFEKYGAASNNGTVTAALLAAGDWTSTASFTQGGIVAGLSTPGYALLLGTSCQLLKTLAANYARLIGGLRFTSNLAGQVTPMQFRDGATAQSSITVETTGVINLRTAAAAGTIIAGSGAVTVSASSIHYLEWDITFGATAAYQLWLDGVSLFSGTGNTRGGTANNYSNAIALLSSATSIANIDDFYLFDSTGSRNNAALLTSPRVETTFPTSDSAVQYAFAEGILGSATARNSTTSGPTPNSLVLRSFRPAVACTINSIGLTPAVTNAAPNYRGVIYADSGGAAGTLMSSGSTVTGITLGVSITLPLTTPQSLSAGTLYWLGFMTDGSSLALQQADGANLCYRAAATFASGAPGTAPAMTSGQPTYLFWGNLTGISGNNWYETSQSPPQGALSYVFDATVTHEDLYNFGALSTLPANVYAVAVKGSVAKSDAGAKTISLRTKSSATDSAGSLAGQAPGTSYGWLSSYFETDPNGGVNWTGTALNAATSGVRVDS